MIRFIDNHLPGTDGVDPARLFVGGQRPLQFYWALLMKSLRGIGTLCQGDEPCVF